MVTQALSTDLDVIAITDHDTIAGMEEAQAAAEGTHLQIVTGVEISTLFNGRECHLLAYSFRDTPLIRRLLTAQKQKRTWRAQGIIRKLNSLGFDITFDEVLGEAGWAPVGRPHIARVMISKGYAATNREVFLRYLGNASSAYHDIDYPDIAGVIKTVHQSGGITVLAHPGNAYNFIEIKELKEAGLDGIECYHSSHNEVHRRRYLTYCESHGLMATGGSDFHGTVADYYRFGVLHILLEADSPLLANATGEIHKQHAQLSKTLCK